MADIKFTEKQVKTILVLIAGVLQDINDDEELLLDKLEQTALGDYLNKVPDNKLAHYGIIGMKWGVRRGTRKAEKLERKVRNIERDFNRGADIDGDTLRYRSAQSRKYAYQTTKRISKITKYLKREADGDMTISNRFIKIKHDPEKLAKAKQYLQDSENLRERYRDIRAQITELKIDALF